MAIRILSSENVKGQLNVKDTQDTVFDSGLSVTRSLTTQTGYINIVGGAFNFNAPASISTKFRSNGNELIRIESDGDFWLRQVGKKLYFQNSAGAAPYIKNSGEDASTTPYGRNLEFYTDGDKRIEIDYAGTTTFDSGSNNIVAVFKSTDTETQVNFVDSTGFASIRSRNDFRFYVGGSSLIRAMDIADDGNVGIGTDSPDLGAIAGTRVLTIASPTAERWGILELAGNRTYGGNQVGELKFISTDATNNGTLVSLTAVNDASATGTGGSLKFNTRANGGSLTERMSINSSGDVGIGTTPQAAGATWRTLFVGASATIVSRQAASGYDSIFANNYYVNSSNQDRVRTTGPSSRMFLDGNNIRFQISPSSSSAPSWSEIMRIDDSGNVGINETSPGSKLQINTSDERGTMLNSTVADKLIYSQINANSSTASTITGAAAIELVGQANASGHGRHAWIGAEGTSNTTFETKLKFKLRGETASGYDWAGSAEAPTIMTLEGSGNVGIGVTEPETPLHVVSNTTDNASTMLVQNSSTGDASIKFNISGDTYSIGIDNSDGDKFKLSYGAVGTSDRIVVDPSGNVGIGTNSPSTELQVESTNPIITLQRNNNGNAGGAVQFRGSDSVVDWQIGTNQVVGLGLEFNFQNSNKVYIETGGNVGIGTNSPIAQLDVAGNTNQHHSVSTSNNGTWRSMINLGTVGWLDQTYSAGRLKVFGYENGNVNVSYCEYYVIRSSTGYYIQQIGTRLDVGNTHGQVECQVSGNFLQVRNVAQSSLGIVRAVLSAMKD